MSKLHIDLFDYASPLGSALLDIGDRVVVDEQSLGVAIDQALHDMNPSEPWDWTVFTRLVMKALGA